VLIRTVCCWLCAGYRNILWGWVDSPDDANYPGPLTVQMHQLLPAIVENIGMKPAARLIWGDALNQRLGTYSQTGSLSTMADIYAEAAAQYARTRMPWKPHRAIGGPSLFATLTVPLYCCTYAVCCVLCRGMGFGDLVSMPEQDHWQYWQTNSANETVLAIQRVCNCFVCETLRAGGAITADVQCTESTDWVRTGRACALVHWCTVRVLTRHDLSVTFVLCCAVLCCVCARGQDMYTSALYDVNWPRPDVCVAADPDLPFCQLLGVDRMSALFYGERPIVDGGWENCPRGTAPDYAKPVGC
jgi:hypothetical protein